MARGRNWPGVDTGERSGSRARLSRGPSIPGAYLPFPRCRRMPEDRIENLDCALSASSIVNRSSSRDSYFSTMFRCRTACLDDFFDIVRPNSRALLHTPTTNSSPTNPPACLLGFSPQSVALSHLRCALQPTPNRKLTRLNRRSDANNMAGPWG